MPATTIRAVALRATAFAVALVLGCGLSTTAALAQDAGPTPTTETVVTTTTAPAGEPTSTETAEPAGRDGPSAADEPTAQADLAVSVSFDDRTYVVGEDVPLTVTITNNGAGVAHAVKGSESGIFIQSHEWGEFGRFGPGGTIDPGATRVIELVGTIQQTGGDVDVTISVEAENEANPSDNQDELTVSFVPTAVTGDAGGVVFGDRDGDGAFDAGEGLSGVRVQLYGFDVSFETTTGADGRFDFDDIPSKLYHADYSDAPDGWIVAFGQRLAVDGTGPATDVEIKAVRPLSETLHASIEFTRDTYRPGDTARMRLTLSNSGTSPIEGIVAGCDRSGGEVPHIEPGPEWAPFDYGGPGVTIGAGRTMHFNLTGTVPDRALDFGVVYVLCDFGNDESLLPGFPQVEDSARVPGTIADSRGIVYHDSNGNDRMDDYEGVANTRVGLVDTDTDRVVAKASTDASGHVTFSSLPAGRYEVRVYGPWALADGAYPFVFVGTCPHCLAEWTIEVEPGPEVPEDPDPTQPPSTTPTTNPPPQAGPPPGGLPTTGASVVGLSVAGLLALALGLAAVLVSRRRRDLT